MALWCIAEVNGLHSRSGPTRFPSPRFRCLATMAGIGGWIRQMATPLKHSKRSVYRGMYSLLAGEDTQMDARPRRRTDSASSAGQPGALGDAPGGAPRRRNWYSISNVRRTARKPEPASQRS